MLQINVPDMERFQKGNDTHPTPKSLTSHKLCEVSDLGGGGGGGMIKQILTEKYVLKIYLHSKL